MKNDIQSLYTRRAWFYHMLFLYVLGGGKKMLRFFREHEYLRSGEKILDAGCGTGNVTRVLSVVAKEKGYKDLKFHAFDLTQAMLDIFQKWVRKERGATIVLKQADVLELECLPHDWKDYDLIVSSAMLEHLPRKEMSRALMNLKALLKPDGKLLVFITKRNWLTTLFIERYWKANTFTEDELKQIFSTTGFSQVRIVRYRWNSVFVVEASDRKLRITYFVHGTTTDNEQHISSGWKDGGLSKLGVEQSINLKEQTKDKIFDAVFCSDLKRAYDSAKLVWEGKYQIIPDARLRECNYGTLNGASEDIVEPMQEKECITNRFPDGESYEDVKARVADFLAYLKKNYDGKHVAIVAHKAPQLSLDVLLKGKTWQQALAEDWRKTKSWQPGWEYEVK